MKLSSCIIFFTLFSFLAIAQKADIQFYNTNQGLSGNSTTSLVQDTEGYIWVINDYKLHRFDGRKFIKRSLSLDCPIPDTEKLLKITVYKDSLFLIAGETTVVIFNPHTKSCEAYPTPNNVRDEIFDLRGIDSRGNYRFHKRSIDGNLLSMVLFREGEFVPTELKEVPTNVYELPFGGLPLFFYDSNNQLYRRLNDEVIQLGPKGQAARRISMPEACKGCIIRRTSMLPNDRLWVIAEPPEGGTQILTAHIEEENFTIHPVNRLLSGEERNTINRIQYINEDELWLLGTNRHLIYYNKKKGAILNFRESLLPILQEKNEYEYVIQDRSGTFWVITQLGMIRIAMPSFSFEQHFSQAEKSCKGFCSFRGITEDIQGNIYAYYYGGLGKIDLDNRKEYPVIRPDGFLGGPWGLCGDDEGIWLNNGQFFNPQTEEVIDVPGSVSLAGEGGLFSKGKDGRLWWVLNHELFYLDASNDQKKWEKKLELPQKGQYHTEAIHVGAFSGKVWISHKGRLLEFIPDKSEQIWHDPADWNTSVTRIMAVEEAADSSVWIGTDNGLVNYKPNTREVKNFTVKDGLTDNFICGLLTEADSCLWLSSNKGLSRFHIPSRSFINFYEEDGITHNEFNRLSFYKAKDGRMFFGGLRGITSFYPDELMKEFKRRNEAAQVVLSSFEFVDEKEDTSHVQYFFGEKQRIDLYYRHRSFSFEYVLTDFRNPNAVFYSYQMEGYEDNWSTPSNFNFTRFSSLPAGNYTFRVKARDSHGLWHPNELAVKVVVHPPWWHTNWAYITYFLLFCGLIFLIYSFLKRRLLLRNQLQLKAEEARQLKELDTFKSRLYTNLTHEFRTPLTVILGMAQQIRSEPKAFLDKGTRLIESNGKNLLRLINQLLDLSKLEDQSFELHMKQGNIIPYLRYITESFQTYANSKNLSLRFFTNLESLIMDFDEDQIQQVLTNLISNALKFTPEGGDILVKLTESKHQLDIEVRDTGIGIAEKDLPHVFDRFYQADDSSTRQGEGTGIGLAHTKELIKIMGGEISVSSEPGKGSSFLIKLPVKKEASETSEQLLATKTILEKASANEIPQNVGSVPGLVALKENNLLPQLLLIEDNHDVVIYLKSCLEGLYQLQVAYNGKIGIDKALEQIPDLIISDIMMPEKDGYEVCDTLKNDERTSHIPIILLTAKADDDAKMTGLRRGADAYLTKPFNKEELLLRLELLVKRQKKMVAHFTKQLRGEGAAQPELDSEDIRVEDAFIQKVRQIVEENYSDEHFNLSVLCQKLRMSRSQLFRKMQALIETSPSVFIRSYRLNKGKMLLETTPANVSEVAWKVGFKTVAHFSKAFQDEFGFPPSVINK